MTHTFLVDNYFAEGQASLRVQTYTRYAKFVKKLLTSPSMEICFLSKILLNDHRSTVCKNVWHLNNITNVNILVVGKVHICISSLLLRK